MAGKLAKTAFFLLLMLLGLSTAALTEDLNVQWIKEFGSPGLDNLQGIACDPAGNICITGFTEAALGGNRHIGGTDMFVAKYDADGRELWTRQLGSAESDQGAALACDRVGNIYVTGHTYGSFEGKTNAGGADIFLIKLEPSGKILWIKQFGSSESDYGLSVTSDNDGNAYVVGDTYGKLTGSRNYGEADVFIMKFDASGDRLWGAQFGTASAEHTKMVAMDISGSIYVTGDTSGSLEPKVAFGGYDVFLAKYSPYGDKVWLKQIGTAGNDFSGGVAGDNAGNIYISGETKGQLKGTVNKGLGAIFLARFDSQGQKIWTRQLGSRASDSSLGLAIDGTGAICIAGDTTGNLGQRKNSGLADIFLVKYYACGNKPWITELGTDKNEFCTGIASNKAGNIYVAGYTEGTFAGNNNAGYADMFIISFKVNGLVLCEKDGITILGGAKGFIEPAKEEKLYIMMFPDKDGKVDMAIRSLAGQLIWNNVVMAKEKSQEMIIWDGRDLEGKTVPPGMYQLQIKGTDIDVQEKIAVVQ
ncbi:MAG: SBBP repeat-containing protein [bacterium]|nr:SBBP repeat-containing protein [bacterium]MDD5353573.1 SBBP repeat-containing protein [bacterium]MDD5756454.1 SBBP repeat-containing protein [bacterium]